MKSLDRFFILGIRDLQDSVTSQRSRRVQLDRASVAPGLIPVYRTNDLSAHDVQHPDFRVRHVFTLVIRQNFTRQPPRCFWSNRNHRRTGFIAQIQQNLSNKASLNQRLASRNWFAVLLGRNACELRRQHTFHSCLPPAPDVQLHLQPAPTGLGTIRVNNFHRERHID